MISEVRFIFNLLNTASKRRLIFFGVIRVLSGIFDLVGIVMIGILLAKLASGLSVNSNSVSQSTGILNFVSISELTILEIAIIAALTFIAKSILAIYITKIIYLTLARTESQIAAEAYGLALRTVSGTIKSYSKSDLNYLLTLSASAISEIIISIITVFSELFLLIAILITFLNVDLVSTFFVLIYFSLISVTLHFFMGIRLKKYAQINSNSSIVTTTTVFDSIQAFREIKSLRKEDFFVKKFSTEKFQAVASGGAISFLNGIPRYVVETSLIIGTLILVAIAFSSGDLVTSAQSIGIFITGGMKITASLLPLQNSFANYKTMGVRAKIITDFMKSSRLRSEPAQIDLNGAKLTNIDKPVGVAINKVRFKYADSDVFALKDVSFRVEPGQVVALIGPSGSGKSTLADLIIRIVEPTSGTISYFTNECDEFEPVNIQFGYVAQKPGIVTGSIAENIALGIPRDELDVKQLEKVLQSSQLDQLISQLPHGFDSNLGKQSDELSGGQLQRIGLARALYANPNLLVLDEATSALDAETEAAISSSLTELRGKCTVIIIAHRLSTVQNADLVHVIEDGSIIASGKFADLAKSNELVARYVELSEFKVDQDL